MGKAGISLDWYWVMKWVKQEWISFDWYRITKLGISVAVPFPSSVFHSSVTALLGIYSLKTCNSYQYLWQFFHRKKAGWHSPTILPSLWDSYFLRLFETMWHSLSQSCCGFLKVSVVLCRESLFSLFCYFSSLCLLFLSLSPILSPFSLKPTVSLPLRSLITLVSI